MTSKSASAESNADQATMTARSVKQAAQMAVTQPTSRSFLRRPRDSIGNLRGRCASAPLQALGQCKDYIVSSARMGAC